jgi:hypothetical protein
MDKGSAAQASRRMRAPSTVAMDLCRFGNMAAASGSPEIMEKLDLVAIEWLVVRGLEVEIRQDHSGHAVKMERTA